MDKLIENIFKVIYYGMLSLVVGFFIITIGILLMIFLHPMIASTIIGGLFIYCVLYGRSE